MADLKISALPASTTPLAGTEILPIVQSATTRQVSVANLTAGRAVSALSLTSTNDATINGVTVGRGGGNVGLNTAVGASALAATSTGDSNAAFGASALASNLAGTGNTATGFTSLRDNTSGNYNVASGYLALATNLSGANNVGIGYSVLSTATATSNNTAIGYEALKVTSGSTNTAIGYQSGIAMTTGTKNVILGSYSGNTGTLDIRISNNNIVLSDGDGNVRAWWDNANARFYGTLLATGITNSALTSGRVTYAGTSGVLQDSANLTFDGTTLSTVGITTTGNTILGNASSDTLNVGNGDLIKDASGNLGLGVTPSAWSAGKNIELGTVGNAITGFGAADMRIISGAYYNAGAGGWIYTATGTAISNYGQTAGSHLWYLAASGTAGTLATFTQAMTLNAVGGLQTLNTVGVGNATPSTSGAGITFPATQSASSNANTLDDYEEGTWTPTQGTFDTWTSPVFTATYTKIGRLVTVFLSQQSGTIGWAASDYMGGLPFTVGTGLQAIGYAGDTTPSSDNGYILADSNSTSLFFNKANASEASLCFTISYQV